MPNARLRYLFEQHLAGKCTNSEKEELAVMLLSPACKEEIKVLMLEAWDNEDKYENLAFDKQENIVNSILSSPSIPVVEGGVVRGMHLWRKIAAVAAVLLLVSVGSYMLFVHKTTPEIVKAAPARKPGKNDIIAPAKSTARITLADGTIVPIDSISSGTLATQGNVNLVKNANGQIIYNALQQASGAAMQYNTLSNPRGSKVVDMTLADGSRVWLNAGSSITYPVAFTGNERGVTITGEAYFEVVHNAKMPFIVRKGQTEITDLGTQFNVNAYENETSIKVTLLEGSVKVKQSVSSQKNNGTIIKPGEQAEVGSGVKIIKGIDVDKVMAWKNGLFNFQDATLEEVMRQLERWYDIEVAYEKDIPKLEFMGKMSRTLALSTVLHALEISKVHFRLEEGRRVVVLP